MVSQVILRLLKEAVVPAFLVIAAKMASIVLILFVFQISWQLTSDTVIPRLTFTSLDDFILVSSWSGFLVILAIASGLLWVIVKAHVFHDTHITPQLTLRLLSWDLISFLTTTVEVSHQALVWLSFLWLLIFLSFTQAYLGYSYWWMAITSFALGTCLTWLFVADVEREIEIVS
ncbi:hypothetical protein KKB83_00395 [Patescibacteria group bacterium]|nr:hypothetical protein [Patescibacteria group bacterium]